MRSRRYEVIRDAKWASRARAGAREAVGRVGSGASTLSSIGNQGRLRAWRQAQARVAAEAVREPGVPLDVATRTAMEQRFNEDFSAVRLHTGASAQRSAQALDAHAFTLGTHVVFERPSSGAPAPELLAHELAHVAQQARGARLGPGAGDSGGLEREADAAAQGVTRGAGMRVAQASPVSVQRQPKRRNVAPDLPPQLLEDLKKMGVAGDAPEGPAVVGDADRKLAAAAAEYLKTGKSPRAADAAGLLSFPFPTPDAPAFGTGVAPLTIGPSLWPPINLRATGAPAAKTPAPQPAPKSTAPTPTVTSPDGLPMTQGQIDALEDDKLFAQMRGTLIWLRTHKESSKRVEQVARFYAALSAAYAKRKTELDLRRAYFGPPRNVDQKLRDSAAVLNLSQELAPAFASMQEPVQFPPQVMQTLPGRDEGFQDDLEPPRTGAGGGEWTTVGGTMPEADPHYLDNFSSFSYDAMSKTYVLHFADGGEAQIPREVVDDPKLAAALAQRGVDSGIRAFKTKDSPATGIHLPARLNPDTLPKLYATIQDNRQAIDNADAGAFVARNLLTYEDIPGADTLNKVTFGLLLLKAGVPLGMGIANKVRAGSGGGPKNPPPGAAPFELEFPNKPAAANDTYPEIPWMSKADVDRMLKSGPYARPANDTTLLPEPLARTGSGDLFFPQANAQPQLRLVPGAEPGVNPFNIPWNAPVAGAGGGKGGGDVLGPGGFQFTLPARTDVSGSRVAIGGTWSAQARRAQTAKAKQDAVQQQIAAEIDRINARRSEIGADEWKDQRAGLTKRLYNLREQQHALQIAQAEPGAVVLTQVKVLGVNKGGTFTATQDITGSGEGRIPDIGVLKPRGKLTLIDSKTANEIMSSIRKRGAPGFKESSAINKQVTKENELRAFGGNWVLEGTDAITNETVWFSMSPSEVDNSRPVAYGQSPQ